MLLNNKEESLALNELTLKSEITEIILANE